MNDIFFTGSLPWWAILLIGAGVSALLARQFLNLRERLSIQRSLLLVFLRGLVYGLLIFFLLGPGMVEQRQAKWRRPLTVLVDTSLSMALPATPDGNQAKRSRLDLVKEKLLEGKEPLIQRLAQSYDLRLHQFGTALEPINPTSLGELAPHGKATRLLESLREAGKNAGAGGGIILFSDGIAGGEDRSMDSVSFPLPIFSVGVGEQQGYKDLRIAALSAPQFAFRGREVQLDVTVQAYGLAGTTVPLYFNRGRNLVSSRSVTIDRDPFEQRVTLMYTPREIGPHSFTFNMPLQAGEQIHQNNHKEFTIQVQRDKIRVLTLSGSPSWNYRFLRMALKQDPFIDLVSFVFLRTPTDSVDVPDSQLSLIPFPIDEIFLEELKNFDVVFFDDFSHRSYFNMLYLEKVRDFVRDGGGLAMVGGIRSFDSGGYGESPLREALPIELDGKGTYQTGASLRTIVTAAGKAHPITRLLPDPKANEEAWKKMPPLTSLNRVLRAKGDVLLQAGPDGAAGAYPLLAVGKFGKGRSLALMSDDIWRWNFIALGRKESPQNHLKLIRQAVRWLAQEPSFEQVQIHSILGSRGPGEKLSFKIRVLKDDFTPASHAALQLRVVGPDGEQVPAEAVPDTEEGEYSAEYIPTKEGSHRVEGEAHLAGRVLGRDRKNFLVAYPSEEREDGRPHLEFLKRMAETSRGEFIPIREWSEKSLDRITARIASLSPSEITERRRVLLWSNPWAFSLILLLLGSEWWLRRKWGLV